MARAASRAPRRWYVGNIPAADWSRRCQSAETHARIHRKLAGRLSGGDHRPDDRDEGPRRTVLPRRLRHGILLALLLEAAAPRPAEDRSVLRARSAYRSQ